MKILAAFDSFKESMTALEAGLAVEKAAIDHEVIIKQLADGGEGTMIALNSALKGRIDTLTVTGPLFQKVQAEIAIIDDMAVIECAQACGIDLVDRNKRDGTQTTTLGVGEMIQYAVNQNCRRILITLGGSATNDGGIGMLMGLGVKFYDKNQQMIKPCGDALHLIDTIDISDSIIKDVDIIGLCDVKNPLLGENGATYIYGPQKGVKDLAGIDHKMAHYAQKSAEILGYDVRNDEGAGAAGGLGFAIKAYLKGKLVPGFSEIARLIELEEAIKQADIIFTGEGSIDRQTLMGKVPQGVLSLANKYDKKVVAFAGKIEDKDLLLKGGFEDVRCINQEIRPIEEMLKNGKYNLEKEVKSYLEEEKYSV